MSSKREIQTKENMISLGIYKPEFDTTISIYCTLVDQYEELAKEFKKQKFKVVENTGYSENKKKNPIVLSMESLRKDILSYATALGLTPQGLRKLKSEDKPSKPASKLETALINFGI